MQKNHVYRVIILFNTTWRVTRKNNYKFIHPLFGAQFAEINYRGS